ncbi:hypothetical protein YTPLAS18_02760 [Nitrospira sp.]|nr:hypothetical protein YTPLAS18_02760 [Nitrospira sp.]
MRVDDPYLIAAGAALLIAGLMVWLLVRRGGDESTEGQEFLQGLSVTSRPILSDTEVSLYNLLRLAVGERYLVFPHLPVWAMLAMQSTEPSTRSRLLKKLAFQRVDFALVHPGCRTARLVVVTDSPHVRSEAQRRREQLTVAVLNAAGIELVRLDPTQPHSLESLAALFGIEPDGEETGHY